ncbi:MAG: hypothetical protein WDO18_17640 [Acidobacteriota bacterium]
MCSRTPKGASRPIFTNATFSHSAVYLGPDRDGMALLAEAVTEGDAEGMGEVRAIQIELSHPYKHAERVSILRPHNRYRLRNAKRPCNTSPAW